MKRFLLLAVVLLLIGTQTNLAQDAVPTLVPPTPIPVTPTAEPDVNSQQSTIARLQQSGVLRVGILYNEPPHGEFSLQGEIVGYDADLARTLAGAWGLELELVQVTRQNRIQMLQAGQVDLLLAAMVQSRDLSDTLEFSQPYRVGAQVMLTRAEDEYRSPLNLANRRVGYVLGTPSETAFNQWTQRTGISVQQQPYFNTDDAVRALFGGDIDAVIGREKDFLRVAFTVLDAVSILEEPIQQEPYAVAFLNGDFHMRNLVNRTLQSLLDDASIGGKSTLENLHSEYFPNETFPFDASIVYEGVAGTPNLAAFPTDIPQPAQSAINSLQNGVVRVAGVPAPDGLPESQARVAEANRNLAERMAQRWGVRAEFVNGDPFELLETGQADMALGITPDWDVAGRVDFSQAYLRHGYRLMLPTNLDFDQFGELRGRIVATIIGDTDARAAADAWADYVGVGTREYNTPESGIARTLIDDRNADVIFADSLQLIPVFRANPGAFKFGPTFYSREYFVIATPRNDSQMRNLVNYTLQEMYRDRTLETLLVGITIPNENPIEMAIMPGSAQYLGFTLGR